MREIKFRAWDKKRKEMIVIEEIHFKYNSIVYDEGIITSPMENFEMMQFIGLKDKNGKEIYEGDVVKYHNPRVQEKPKEFVGKVFWVDEWAQFSLGGEGGFIDFERAGWLILEVIGNIHENPELLEVKK